MWSVSFLALVAICLWQAWRRGPNLAVGTTSMCALFVPTWLKADLWGMPLDLRVASGIAALTMYCFHRRAVFRTRLGIVDWAAIGLVVIHLISDWTNDGFSWLVPLRAYGEWAIPFLLGRVAIQSWDDARAILPFAVVIGMLFGVCACIECAARTNLFESFFGIREIELSARTLERWGIRRACGPTYNPIYFGTLQLLLFPWSLFAVAAAIRGDCSRFWFFSPVMLLLGIICTMSRAPVMGVFIVLYVVAVVMSARWRPWLLGVAILGSVLIVANYKAAMETLNLSSGESQIVPTTIVVDNEEVQYTSTLHRIHLFRIFKPAIERAGLFGFGTDRTSVFPPLVPYSKADEKAIRLVWSVDNEFILIVLRFGYLGLAMFLLVGLSATVESVRLSQRAGLRRGMIAAGIAGALLATLMLMMTVWMPHDYGFWYLWTVGAVAGLRANV
jgi:hypothetical protein